MKYTGPASVKAFPLSFLVGLLRIVLGCIVLTSVPAELLSQTTTLHFPRLVTNGGSGGPTDDSELTGFRILNSGTTAESVTLTAYNCDGSLISGTGIVNPVSLYLAPGAVASQLDTSLFGAGLLNLKPVGWVKATGSGRLSGTFASLNNTLSMWNEALATSRTATSLVFAEVKDQGFNIVNPNASPANVQLQLRSSDGGVKAATPVIIPTNGAIAALAAALFPGTTIDSSDHMRVTSTNGLLGYQYFGASGQNVAGLNDQGFGSGARTFYALQYVVGGGYLSFLSLVNLDADSATVTLALSGTDGSPLGSAQVRTIPPFGKLYISDPAFFIDPGSTLTSGSVRVTSDGPRLIGVSTVRYTGVTQFALPLLSRPQNNVTFPYSNSTSANFSAGLILRNPASAAETLDIQLYNEDGSANLNHQMLLGPGSQVAVLLNELFPGLNGSGTVKITSSGSFLGSYLFLFVDTKGNLIWSAIPQNDHDLMRRAASDIDGDAKSDFTVFRPGAGLWFGLPSGTPGAYNVTPWGLATDIPVPGDYDGDGKVDVALWRPSTGVWYILPSSAHGAYTTTQWGLPDDMPFPGDYDGDGKTDIAVWRPSTGIWFILPSGAPGTFTAKQWGVTGDIAVPGDYDGDGKTDIAVWRPGTGVWYIVPSSSPETYASTQWGISSDTPVPADYDGDGKCDIAVWRSGSGVWYILPSGSPGSYAITQWGVSSDIPVPGDYDGDGRTDIAVWRSETGIWFVLPTSAPGSFTITYWGIAGDLPVSPLTRILGSIP